MEEEVRVEIVDVNGKLIKVIPNYKAKDMISLGSIETGVYLVKMLNKNNSSVRAKRVFIFE